MAHRIAAGGVHIESSAFSPHRAGAADFAVVRDDALLARYDDGGDPSAVEWVPLVHAHALPGGVVEAGWYEELRAELLRRLAAAHRAAPLDGVYLDLHGAMSVEGAADAEGELVAAVRDVVGPGPLISASMDPHGNVSRLLAQSADLLTSHRMSPHEDAHLTRARARAKLVGCLAAGVRPRRAWVSVPVLLPGEKTCTRDEPARRLYGRLPAVEAEAGVVDAALWIGYAWADEPRCRASVVVSGTDEALIAARAEELARAWWEARDEFAFSTQAADADAAIAAALAAPERPYLVSDSGDNPTAGGSGDVPYLLARLLAVPELASGARTAIWASLVDPAAVAASAAAGPGAAVELRVGGALGWDRGTRVPLRGEVTAVRRGDPVGGDVAVVRAGGVHAVLTERRKPYHRIADFTELGLNPAGVDLTAVKVGYLVPELYEAARGWTLALTPGGVDQDIPRLGHRRLARPIHPLDPGMPEPALRAEVFP